MFLYNQHKYGDIMFLHIVTCSYFGCFWCVVVKIDLMTYLSTIIIERIQSYFFTGFELWSKLIDFSLVFVQMGFIFSFTVPFLSVVVAFISMYLIFRKHIGIIQIVNSFWGCSVMLIFSRWNKIWVGVLYTGFVQNQHWIASIMIFILIRPK